MSANNVSEQGVLAWLFQGVDMLRLGEAFRVSLHTGDPGEDGGPQTLEATYDGYCPMVVWRDKGCFDITPDGEAVNAVLIQFPEPKSGETLTHFGLSSGAFFVSGALQEPLAVGPGISPWFPAGTLRVSLD